MRFEYSDDGSCLTVSSPAKLNLYLEILGRRADGYHDIDTLMQAISLVDTIEFRRRRDQEVDLQTEAANGVVAPPADSSNLVVRAVEAVVTEIGARPSGLAIRLFKAVPSGAGLGGGSSNAAATLLALDRLWSLALSDETLERLAASLGSDVAFFLHGGLARCQGRGEIVTPVGAREGAASTLYYVVCAPPVPVSTALIYRNLGASMPTGKPLTTPKPLATMSFSAVWAGLEDGSLFTNRLQETAFELFPELRQVFDSLRQEPFIAVQMTGSGSALFGLTRDRTAAESAAARLARRFEPRTASTFGGFGSPPVRVEVVTSLPGWRR